MAGAGAPKRILTRVEQTVRGPYSLSASVVDYRDRTAGPREPAPSTTASGLSLLVGLPGDRAISRPVDAEILCILRGNHRVVIPVLILPK